MLLQQYRTSLAIMISQQINYMIYIYSRVSRFTVTRQQAEKEYRRSR